MPQPGLIRPIPTSPPIFVPLAPSFQQTVADELGNIGTTADGFEAILATVFAAFAADDSVGILDDSDLVSALFNVGDFQNSQLDPIQADIVHFQAGGDTVINGGQPPPPTGPPSSPPSGPPGPPQQCGYPPNTVITNPVKQDLIQQYTDELGRTADELQRLGC